MVKLKSVLQERFQKKEKPKMSELSSQTAQGQLTPFSGLFGVGALGEKEKQALTQLLSKYALEENKDISEDLFHLLSLTTEVKAINNQAVLLHGERIKKAQDILKKYRNGAFTAWLQATYGNRQTPYNFLLYYEFYLKVPKVLHTFIEAMPRQAVYSLASREGDFAKKEEIVRNYKGETKQQMISIIRTFFPLNDKDKRKEKLIENMIKQLERIHAALTYTHIETFMQKRRMLELLKSIKSLINKD